MHILRFIPSVIPFALAVPAFVFSLLAITSKDWAFQDHYANNTDAISQVNVSYTIYRSPFQICSEYIIPNGTIPENNTDADGNELPPPDIPYIYINNCTRFPAFGLNRTSCELASVTNSNVLPQVGDRRLCQQIHYAGNYSIASTTFIGTSFILVIFMALLAFLVSVDDHDARSSSAAITGKDGGEVIEMKSSQENETSLKDDDVVTNGEDMVVAPPPRRHRHHNHNRDSSPRYTRFLFTPYVNLLIVTFYIIGVATALISQFYAILAFTQSAPNNGDFTTSLGNREHHDPWVQGKALSVYMTLSWAFAAAAGLSAFAIWRFPVPSQVI